MMYENSRYLQTRMYKNSNKNTYVLKIRKRHSFNMQRCTIHEWCRGDTLDGVAFRYYGVSAFRWAILDANPKYRTEFEIEPGDLVSIPSYDEVVEKVN